MKSGIDNIVWHNYNGPASRFGGQVINFRAGRVIKIRRTFATFTEARAFLDSLPFEIPVRYIGH